MEAGTRRCVRHVVFAVYGAAFRTGAMSLGLESGVSARLYPQEPINVRNAVWLEVDVSRWRHQGEREP